MWACRGNMNLLASQWTLLQCKPYMCPMIVWFGLLERQLKEGLFDDHIVAKHHFGKSPYSCLSSWLQRYRIFSSNLILLVGLYGVMQQTQLWYHNVKHSGNHVIMLFSPYLCRLRDETRSNGFSLVLTACIGNSNINDQTLMPLLIL